MVYFSRLLVLVALSMFSCSNKVFSYGLHSRAKRLFEPKLFGSKSSRTNEKQTHFVRPLSDNQRKYTHYLKNISFPLVVAMGSAGTGKTMLACMEAIRQLHQGTVQKIVLTRPLISVEEEEIGFLPGSMVAKMDPWTRPMFDIFREVYSINDLNIMVRNGVIEIAPLAFMRGRTFHDSFIIADEMQNSSPGQMLMLTTRLGRDSKMVITGDLQQSDRQDVENGLKDFVHKYESWNSNCVENRNVTGLDIGIVKMNDNDIFRSPFVSRILDIYSKTHVLNDSDVVIDLMHSTTQGSLFLARGGGILVAQSDPTNITYSSSFDQNNRTQNVRNSRSRPNSDASLIPPYYMTKRLIQAKI